MAGRDGRLLPRRYDFLRTLGQVCRRRHYCLVQLYVGEYIGTPGTMTPSSPAPPPARPTASFLPPMWEHQSLFRVSAQLFAEGIFNLLDRNLRPVVFLLGLASGR